MGYMDDRKLGYIVLIALLLFAMISMGTIVYAVFMPVERRVIEFDRVKCLKIADPVRVRGVTVARISRIQWRNGKALVTVASQSKLPIRRDYFCAAVDIGVMGDRMIELSYGSPSEELISPRDTLKASFVIGPSEALGMVERLSTAVEDFTRVSQLLLAGDGEHESLVTRIGRFVDYTDSLSMEIATFSYTFNRAVPQKLDTLGYLVQDISEFIGKAASVVPSYIESLDGYLGQIGEGIERIETLLNKVEPALRDVQGPDGVVWRSKIAALLRSLHELRRLVEEIRQSGLRLKVVPSLGHEQSTDAQ